MSTTPDRFEGRRSTGCYNLLRPTEESVCLTVWLPEDAPFPQKVLSESGLDHRDDPGSGEDDPFVMVDAIEAYQKRLWISTSRDEITAKIAWIRANESRLRKLWLGGKLRRLQGQAARLATEIAGVERDIADLDEPVNA